MGMLRNGEDHRILIFGNSGSGKTWLALRISGILKIPVVHFDERFWEPGGFNRKRDKKVVFQEIHDYVKARRWILEGVFGELAEIALVSATLVILLDKSRDECRTALLSRGSESSRQLDPIQAQQNFHDGGSSYRPAKDRDAAGVPKIVAARKLLPIRCLR